jgi:small-conductance mechanosensitive channel
MNSFWNNVIWGNTVKDWTIAFAIIAGSFILLKLIKRIVIIRLEKWTEKTKTRIDDLLVSVIERTGIPFFYLLAIYIGLTHLNLGPKGQRILNVAILLAGTFFAVRLITSVVAYFIKGFARPHEDTSSGTKQVQGIIIIANLIIWMLGILFLIDNLGYSITTVLTGLGIGGIAIALASQAILGDLFSYFVIFFDKPFEIGDFIIVGKEMGTVEYTGIKTTRIRALSGEQIVMSNTDLTNSRVQNFKRLDIRRVVFYVRVAYETPAEKLKRIPLIIKQIIESQQKIQFDRAHIYEFGEFSLNIEIVYNVVSPDYNLYMDIQQAINIAIIEAFEKEDISFAYPTRKILLNGQATEDENVHLIQRT